MPEAGSGHSVERPRLAVVGVVGVFLLILSLTVFRGVLSEGHVLVTTDDNYGEIIERKQMIPEGFSGVWVAGPILGRSGILNLNLSYSLLSVMSPESFTNWIHAITLALASVFLFIFLRLRGVGMPAALLGIVIAYWLGTSLTLTYAGHLTKYGTLVFSSLTLCCLEMCGRTRRWPWAVLSGVSLGYMFLEQQDLALFIGLFLGVYALFALAPGFKESKRPTVALLGLMLGVAVLVAGTSLSSVYATNKVGGDDSAQAASVDPGKRYEFATQWSVPPDELIEVVAPGYMGWRTGSESGTYWGRTGRDANWPQSGFRNFRLENTYLGAIPVVLILMTLFLLFVLKARLSVSKRDLVLWTVFALVALLLAFGRHFPLYRMFYALPGIDSIRNPNKFLHVFQIAVGVLAAFSLESLFGRSGVSLRHVKERKLTILFASVLGVLGVIMIIQGARMGSFPEDVAQSIQAAAAPAAAVSPGVPDPRQALASSPVGFIADLAKEGYTAPEITAISTASASALQHGGWMWLFAVGVACYILLTKKKNVVPLRNVLAGLIVAACAVDAVHLSRHYIVTQDARMLVGDTDMTRYLRTNQGYNRTAMLMQQGIYNNWLTYLMPAQGIRMFNFTQMPRMPQDYQQFLGAGSQGFGQQIHMMRLAGVTHLMLPKPVWDQIVSQQGDKSLGLSSVYEYRYVQGADGGPMTIAGSPVSPAEHVITSIHGAFPRFSAASSWTFVPDGQALQAMFSPQFLNGQTAVFPESSRNKVPAMLPTAQSVSPARVEVTSYTDSDYTLRVDAQNPVIVVSNDRFQDGWRATLNGEQTEILKCNHFMRGVVVPAGSHEVRFVYDPGGTGLLLQGLGTLAGLLAGVVLLRGAFAGRRKPTDQVSGSVAEVS